MPKQKQNFGKITTLSSDNTDEDNKFLDAQWVNDRDLASLEIQKNLRYKANTGHRRKLVWFVIVVTIAWLTVVAILLFFNHLSETVFIALLCTTTANVLGLPYIVLKGMFPQTEEM